MTASRPADGSGEAVRVPLSYGQRALWFVHSLAPESIAYQGMYLWRVPGAVDEVRLQGALDRVVARHEALRTTLQLEHGEPVQWIEPRGRIEVRVHDASEWSEDELDRHVAMESERPYDLTAGPFIRPRLYRLSATDHRFLMAIHHIVLDHWSIVGIMEELRAFYVDPAAPLPPPSTSYRDFVQWQEEMLRDRRGAAQETFWREAMAGEIPVLDLPTDRPRPAVQTYRGGSLQMPLDREVTDRLQAYAANRGATPFMVLLAAFQALLHRYTGQEDLVVGTPMAGRSGAPGFDRVVGYFTNLVPLRARFSADPSFDDLFAEVRGSTLDALQHQDYPFSLLVERLGVARDASRAPLCDVILAWEGAPPAAAKEAEGGLDLRLERLAQLGAAVDTAWSIFHRGDGGLALAIQYNVDLFDAETIEAMARHFGVLLRGVAENPSLRVSQLPLMESEERRRILFDWNRTGAEARTDAAFHRLFEERVAGSPEATAVVAGDTELDYRELDRRANRLARRLVEVGVERGDRVGLCMDRSPELVVGMLGSMKAGAAFVPLDPSYPADRLAFMIEDSGPRALLTRRELVGSLPAHEAVVVLVDELGEPEAADDVPPGVDAGPRDAAYVIYTSGSTGRPKGVVVEHSGLANVSDAQRRAFGLGPEARVAQFASLSFDACVWEIVMALRWGGALVLGSREEILPGAPLARFLRTRRVRQITIPPSALATMGDADLPDLETIMVAGERCPEDLPRRWGGRVRFFNLYGPTEATIWSTYARLGETEVAPPIGRPIDNTEAYVLDPALRPVPVGVAGELVVGGAGLTRGYLGRPGLTAERYVPDPFTGGGRRLYRTGDRVRWRRDGDLEFLGRLDHQVKLRGFRIELGEIEAVLRDHPRVREALAVIRPVGSTGDQLVAYVATGSATASGQELDERLHAKLPDYMVPRYVIPMEEFPLTPNGKVDRDALPEPATPEGSSPTPASVTGLEGDLVAIWRKVLGTDHFGLNDSFFDLGGHSLLLAKVQERLEGKIGRELDVAVLFRYPTISGLAAHLGGDEAAEPDTAAEERAAKRRRSAGRSRRRRSRS